MKCNESRDFRRGHRFRVEYGSLEARVESFWSVVSVGCKCSCGLGDIRLGLGH